MVSSDLILSPSDGLVKEGATEKVPEKAPGAGETIALDEVARMLEVSIETIRRWSKIGVIQPLPDGKSGKPVYSISEVYKFLPRKM